MPQVGVIAALVGNGVGFGTAVGAAFGLGPIGTAVLKVAGSLLLSTAANALLASRQKAPRAQDIRAQLFQPTATPAYRFVYGETRAAGTPYAWPVKGPHIYGCWIINSRPSAGPFTLYLDGREVELTGDPYDFAGGGALATNEPFVNCIRVWIQRGEKTTPPLLFTTGLGIDGLSGGAPFSAERPDFWKTTDGWQGRTVVWMLLFNGDNGRRQERWPSSPPQVQVEGRFSRVWDPRDPAQDPDDPDTWGWSDNQALCLLDFVRQNPVESWPLDLLDLPSFVAAANAADQPVPLSGGGTEPRYRVGGWLVFEAAEFEDLAAPLIAAGASDLIRVGGRLGIAPGIWQAPAYSVGEFFGDTIGFTSGRPGPETPRALRVTYASADRGYETAELAEWALPGGGGTKVDTLALDMVTSPTQAARVRNITGNLMALQRGLEGVLPPEALVLSSGDVVTVDLPAPLEPANGSYRVRAMSPALLPISDDPDRLSMRIPVRLEETAESVYAWNPATDEPVVVELSYDGVRQGVAPPGALSVARDDLDTGGTIVPRLRFAFDPSPTTAVDVYEWQFRADGGVWESGGNIAADVRDGSGLVFGHAIIAEGVLYDIRVRAFALSGRSEWRTITGVGSPFVLTGSITAGDDADVTWAGTTPAVNYAGARIYQTDTASFVDPVLLRATTPGNSVTAVDVVLGPGYFWAVPVTLTGAEGAPLGPFYLTVREIVYVADFEGAVYELDGAAAAIGDVLAVTRASVATFVDGAGLIQTAAVNVPRIDHAAGVPCLLIEPAGANAFTWSEAMDNAAWTKTNATVTANAIAAPDGATTADLLVENTATSSHRTQRTRAMESGVAATISLFAKAGGRDILRLRASGTGMTAQAAEVQISTGTVSVQAGTPTVETVALAGGWRRITFTFTPNVTVSGLFEVYLCSAFGVSSYTGDGVSGAYLWGAQDGAGSYIATAGAAGSRAADVPAMQGVSGVMDLLATYDNGTTAAFDAAPVLPGYWPTLTRQRLRSLIGTI
ncbi:minor tail protein [Nostoc phage Nsp-JY21]